MNHLPTLTLAAIIALPALAQAPLSPGLGESTATCAAFTAMDSVSQLEMLSTIQPLGDEIDPNDADAARQWAADVTRACNGHPDRLLDEAAREALGE